MLERLQKLIARAGVSSRRTAEALIQAGAVRVNGQVVNRLGAKADPEHDRIDVGGRILRFPSRRLYLLLNKPRGYVSTKSDPAGRRTVFDLLRKVPGRLIAVGRLPYEAEGLLLLTSDGGFADILLRGRLPQTYRVKVKGSLDVGQMALLHKLAARNRSRGFQATLVKPGPNPWYEVTLVEPRSDWLRTALFRMGHPVEKLKRVSIGSLRDPKLAPGEYRELSPREVDCLLAEAGPSGGGRKAEPRRGWARASGATR